MASRKEQKARAREERLAREVAARDAARRKRQLTIGGVVASVIIVVVAAVILVVGGGSNASQRLSRQGSTPKLKLTSLASLGHLKTPPGAPLGPEAIPLPNAAALAGTASMASGATVDGIQCQSSEQSLFHIHAHLTVFINGTPRQIPYGIGIPHAQTQATAQGPFVNGGSCLYWLHTHAADGIIHIESPVRRTFTLGDFFDIWGQQLGPNRAGPAAGPVTAIYNGKLYHGNPRDIPLNAHAQIQLDVGRPLVGPVTITFANGL